MFPEQFLSIVGPIERVAVLVVARARVVAADDEVGAAVVLADDRVPDRLPRPAHAHGEIQQTQLRGLIGILFENVLVGSARG